MTIPDLQATYIAAFDRLRTASAGSAVRASLGVSTGLITVDALKGVLPLCPFLAWQGGDVDMTELDADDMPFGWWICDVPIRGYSRINALFTLIRAAYPHDWRAATFTKLIHSPKEAPDTSTSLLMRPIFYAVSARQ